MYVCMYVCVGLFVEVLLLRLVSGRLNGEFIPLREGPAFFISRPPKSTEGRQGRNQKKKQKIDILKADKDDVEKDPLIHGSSLPLFKPMAILFLCHFLQVEMSIWR